MARSPRDELRPFTFDDPLWRLAGAGRSGGRGPGARDKHAVLDEARGRRLPPGSDCAMIKPMHAAARRSTPRPVTASTARRKGQGLLRKLGPDAKGKYVAIDMRDGSAYLGDTSLAAVQAGKRANPSGRFFIERLGYRAAGMLKRRP